MSDFKYPVGEEVEMRMGRAVYAHFHKERAIIVSRYRTPNGEELYRMNPIDRNLQQNVRFSADHLRKVDALQQIPYRPAPIYVTILEESI